jgi:hypothetical protein
MNIIQLGARTGALLLLLSGLGACSDDGPTGPAKDAEVALLSVTPAGGETDVDPSSSVTVQFERPMAAGSEAYCALHEGGLDGPEVQGHWEWSHENRHLTFQPDEPLQHQHRYTLHVGGGVEDEQGRQLNFEQHRHAHGGEYVHEHEFGSGAGMMGGHEHTGDGWQHQNGSLGMSFSFTTAP